MGRNTFEYSAIFQKMLDQQVQQKSTSAWMEQNAGMVKYNGGDTVKIPNIALNGLADYDRTKGYESGSVTLSYENMKLTQDRGRSFMLDSMDVNETNFVANAGNVMGVFQKEQVIPEIDAYRYSKIASLALENGQHDNGVEITTDNVFSHLKESIMAVQNVLGRESELVICMNILTQGKLESSKEYYRHVNIGEFNNGQMKTQVKMIDGLPILPIPSARFRTKYEFLDGKTSDQTAGGFKSADDSKGINWIIMPKRAPIAVSKTDKVKVIEPEVNQQADAWKIMYRKFHDIWVPANQLKNVFVSTANQ